MDIANSPTAVYLLVEKGVICSSQTFTVIGKVEVCSCLV